MFYRIGIKKPPEKCEITVKIALFGVSSSLLEQNRASRAINVDGEWSQGSIGWSL